MSWWWPFKKREALQAERDFRDSLDQALLRHDDLEQATAQLKEGRKSKQKKPSGETPADAPRTTRTRNV